MQQIQKGDYRQLCRLQNENYELKQQLQDLKAKYENVKKEQQIWEQINRHNMNEQQLPSRDSQQLTLMKQQFVAIVREKQQQQQCIRQLRQKIQDMKYTMQEMRQLNEKQQRIHLREVELFEMERSKYLEMLGRVGDGVGVGNSNMNGWGGGDGNSVGVNKLKSVLKEVERKLAEANQRIQQLEQQLTQQRQSNIKNHQKLQKCSQITKQMQQYYTQQLQSKQHLLTQLQSQLSKHNNYRQSQHYYELPSPHSKLLSLNTNEDCSSLKCSSIVSEYQHQQQLMMGNGDVVNFFDQKGQREREKDKDNRLKERLQQKYSQIFQDMKSTHSKQVSTLHQKIHYLTLKIQALQAQKSYLIKTTPNHSNITNLSHSQTFYIPQHLQSLQSLNQQLHNQSIVGKSFKNLQTQQQKQLSSTSSAVNILKLSKTSANNNNNNDSFTQLTPKSEFSQSLVRESSQSNKEMGSGPRYKLMAVKTPNKTVQKSVNLAGNRNQCSYQRVALGQSNGNGC